MNKWTKEEFELAKSLVESGLGFNEIGVKLNRTRDSVRNKMNKSGVRFTEHNPGRENRKCLNCGKEFRTTMSENKVFCGHSCSATYNNKLRDKKDFGSCLNCETKLNRKGSKYCNQKCDTEYKFKLLVEKIESGDTSISSKLCKKYLIHKHGNKCMKCGWCEVNSMSGNVPIELEHKDGDSTNNSLDNLELLCPNCHSLTPTYKALNIGNGRHKRRERYRNGKSF